MPQLPIPAAPTRIIPLPLLGALLLLAGGICIGFAPIGLRYSEMGPQATAFWRYAFALPILFLLATATHRRLPGRPPAAVLVAGICFALDIGLWHTALTMTSVANATFLVNLGNVGAALLAWWWLGERPTMIWAVAAGIAAAGAAALSLGGQIEGGIGDLRGDGLALIAAMLVAGYMVFSKQARERMNALSVIFWLTAVEVVVGFVLTLVSGEAFFPETPSGWIAPVSLALLAQVAGQGLIIAGLGLTPTAIAGLLVLIQPVAAALLSWRLFGETLMPLQIVGAALVLVGIAMSQRKPRAVASDA